MIRLAVAFASAFCWVCAFAQSFVPPESGKTVDESFRVALRQELPQDCVALIIQGVDLDVIVALDKRELKDRAARDARFRARTEDFFRTADNRSIGSTGCIESTYCEIAEHVWMFDAAVEAGEAVVLDGRNKTAAPYAIVRYFGEEAFGGHITYAIPGQRPFRAPMWWVR